MSEGHEDFFGSAFEFGDELADDVVGAGEAIFIFDAIEDTFGGMALFLFDEFVFGYDLFDDIDERVEFWFRDWFGSLVAWRAGVDEDFFEGFPVHTGFANDLAFADAIFEDAFTNIGPLFHICVHLQAPKNDEYLLLR